MYVLNACTMNLFMMRFIVLVYCFLLIKTVLRYNAYIKTFSDCSKKSQNIGRVNIVSSDGLLRLSDSLFHFQYL